jgi:ribosome-associated protein
MDSREKAIAGAIAAEDIKAEDVTLLWVDGLTTVADCFVICTGNSAPHLRAVRDNIEKVLREDHEIRPRSKDGVLDSKWVILDYGDVVFHIFLEEARRRYALEDLWSDAPVIENWSTLPSSK